MWNYAEKWDAPPATSAVTLGEGHTPLVRSRRIGAALGLTNLWFKLETANPTGSYKDRFAAAAVSHLHHARRTACFGMSSGNTGAALAAYCARIAVPCYLAIVEGAPEGKLKQMLAYGARLFRIKDFGCSPEVNAAVIDGLRAMARELDGAFEVSAFLYSPLGMAGVQTISYEIAEAFAGEAFSVFSPAGGGGLTLAVARGVERWGAAARVHCVQAEGNDTIASALRAGETRAHSVQSTTEISGLQVGNVLDGDEVIDACRRSGGQGHVVTDRSVWSWQARLAREEGIFCEPAGAVALAGIEAAAARGEIRPDENVACLVTGSGFKDERSLARLVHGAEVPLISSFAAFDDAVRQETTRR